MDFCDYAITRNHEWEPCFHVNKGRTFKNDTKSVTKIRIYQETIKNMAGVAGLEPIRHFIGFSSKSIISNEINDLQEFTKIVLVKQHESKYHLVGKNRKKRQIN